MKATIYTDRLKWLLAKGQDKRNAYEAECSLSAENGDKLECNTITLYGLANTEHQFLLGIVSHLFPNVRKKTAREIQQAMAEELATLAGNQLAGPVRTVT